MDDLCIDLKMVRPGFRKAARAMDTNHDKKVCLSENGSLGRQEFQAFINAIKFPDQVILVRDLDATQTEKVPAKKPAEKKRPIFKKL